LPEAILIDMLIKLAGRSRFSARLKIFNAKVLPKTKDVHLYNDAERCRAGLAKMADLYFSGTFADKYSLRLKEPRGDFVQNIPRL